MTKVVIRTGDLGSFFARAKAAARRADQAQKFEAKVTLSFEDPRRMWKAKPPMSAMPKLPNEIWMA